MNIYTVINDEGDCEWQGLAESKRDALARYGKETGARRRGDYAVPLVPAEDARTMSEDQLCSWADGYSAACEEMECRRAALKQRKSA